MLTQLKFKNYKAFATEEQVELRPITIFIGRNSSGKSVCSRLPLLLREGLAPLTRVPLNLVTQGVDFGGSLIDLIHGRRGHGSITLGLEVETPTGLLNGFTINLQHYEEYQTFQVSDLEVVQDSKAIARLHWQGTDPKLENTQFVDQLTGETHQLTFNGIFPSPHPQTKQSGQLESVLDEVRQRLYSGLSPCLYLGPFREKPEREYRYLGGRPDDVGFHGRGAAQVLAYAQTQKDEKTTRDVSEWFRKHLGAALEVDPGELFRIILHRGGSKINLVDVGTGISQVFPLVLQRLAQGGNQPKIEIVEQPELHLHPGAHGDIADLYIGASLNSKIQFVIETHSEVFLLRIRRRIAEGKMNPAHVVIYWVDDRDGISQIKKIEVDDKGDLSDWPAGVFSEDFEEVKAIRKASP